MNVKRVGPALTGFTLLLALAVKPVSAELLTVATAPNGLTVAVDGTNYTAPVTFDWVAGSVHTLDTPSPQVAGDGHSRSSFATWSDDGAQSHSITMPAFDTTNTASFVTQYLLDTDRHTVRSGHGHKRPPRSLVRCRAIGLADRQDQHRLQDLLLARSGQRDRQRGPNHHERLSFCASQLYTFGLPLPCGHQQRRRGSRVT